MWLKGRNSYDAVSAFTKLLVVDELPLWMRSDPHIRSGYREELKSVANCIDSLFYVHNETVNIWSHLLPATVHCLLLAIEIRFARKMRASKIPKRDSTMVHLYVVSVALCLLFSGAYHLLNAHSERVARVLLKLDYLGIVLNTAAACVTSTWFGLRHQPDLRLFYMTFCGGLSALIFSILLKPSTDGPGAALWRTILFAGFVGSGFVPMIHNYFRRGIAGLRLFPYAAATKTVTFYFVGAMFYVTRFPERLFVETFDIWGSSHQIFHISVMIGQIVYIRGLRVIAAQM